MCLKINLVTDTGLYMDTNIAVTGSSGFVGGNLLPHLNNNGFAVIKINLRELETFLEPLNFNAIIHLAGKAHDTSNTSNPEEYFKVNTELTIQLFNKFLKSDIRDFIYFSSVKAVADTVSEVLTENVIPDPKTPYGKSKQKAEQYLLNQILPEGKRMFIIRPCMIHGPGNKGNLNLLYKFVSKGIPYPLAAFENKRSFLSIDNLCFALTEILKNSSIPSGVYNLADDDTLSTNEMVKIIAATIGKQARLFAIPQSALKILAKVGDKMNLPINSERLKKLTENYIVSNQKIKDAIGINFFPISAREGLKKTIESFK
jgi:nucleoside-diphosphate-sugar epimerase